MICALCAFQGGTAQVTHDQLDATFFGCRSTSYALVATLDGDLVGYAGITSTKVLHKGMPSWDIHHLFVVPAHRTKGLATALIKAVKTLVITQNATRLTIGTDVGNMTAIGAYRRMAILNEIADAGPRFRVNLRG
jgi:GNAT superfamily N-acetyltransferase